MPRVYVRWWGVSSSKKDDGRGVDRRDAERKGKERSGERRLEDETASVSCTV